MKGSWPPDGKTEAKRMERMLEITSRSGAAAVTSSKHLLQSDAICSICFCIVVLFRFVFVPTSLQKPVAVFPFISPLDYFHSFFFFVPNNLLDVFLPTRFIIISWPLVPVAH